MYAYQWLNINKSLPNAKDKVKHIVDKRYNPVLSSQYYHNYLWPEFGDAFIQLWTTILSLKYNVVLSSKLMWWFLFIFTLLKKKGNVICIIFYFEEWFQCAANVKNQFSVKKLRWKILHNSNYKTCQPICQNNTYSSFTIRVTLTRRWYDESLSYFLWKLDSFLFVL